MEQKPRVSATFDASAAAYNLDKFSWEFSKDFLASWPDIWTRIQCCQSWAMVTFFYTFYLMVQGLSNPAVGGWTAQSAGLAAWKIWSMLDRWPPALQKFARRSAVWLLHTFLKFFNLLNLLTPQSLWDILCTFKSFMNIFNLFNLFIVSRNILNWMNLSHLVWG